MQGRKLLIVKVQNNWHKLVEVRHSYYDILQETEEYYLIDKTSGDAMVSSTCPERINKTVLDRIIYNEMYAKTENGKYWGFDAQVAILVKKEDAALAEQWRHEVCNTVVSELRVKNSEIKAAYKAIAEMC